MRDHCLIHWLPGFVVLKVICSATPSEAVFFPQNYILSLLTILLSATMSMVIILHCYCQSKKDILSSVDEEYGISQYGSVKFTKNELYWIGYIYRYYAYTYQILSRQAYKIVKPKELRELFLAYHTMDPKQAIERILEAKKYPTCMDKEISRQYKIIRKIRADK